MVDVNTDIPESDPLRQDSLNFHTSELNNSEVYPASVNHMQG